jgi:hypothetical protein
LLPEEEKAPEPVAQADDDEDASETDSTEKGA